MNKEKSVFLRVMDGFLKEVLTVFVFRCHFSLCVVKLELKEVIRVAKLEPTKCRICPREFVQNGGKFKILQHKL